MRSHRATTVSFCALLAATPLCASSEATLDRLESQILAKYRDVPPSAVIQIIGVPQATTEREGAEYLTWQTSKQSGSFASGFGKATTHECRATFEFRNDKLTSVSLVGAGRADRTLCKKIADPLLTNSPSIAAQAPAESKLDSLTNADVVKLTKAKLEDDVIIDKIKSSACRFDMSTDALIVLKEAGVSDRVIQAMLERSNKKN